MLQQMLAEDKADMVREAVVKSLGIIMGYIDDPDKYSQVCVFRAENVSGFIHTNSTFCSFNLQGLQVKMLQPTNSLHSCVIIAVEFGKICSCLCNSVVTTMWKSHLDSCGG